MCTQTFRPRDMPPCYRTSKNRLHLDLYHLLAFKTVEILGIQDHPEYPIFKATVNIPHLRPPGNCSPLFHPVRGYPQHAWIFTRRAWLFIHRIFTLHAWLIHYCASLSTHRAWISIELVNSHTRMRDYPPPPDPGKQDNHAPSVSIRLLRAKALSYNKNVN